MIFFFRLRRGIACCCAVCVALTSALSAQTATMPAPQSQPQSQLQTAPQRVIASHPKTQEAQWNIVLSNAVKFENIRLDSLVTDTLYASKPVTQNRPDQLPNQSFPEMKAIFVGDIAKVYWQQAPPPNYPLLGTLIGAGLGLGYGYFLSITSPSCGRGGCSDEANQMPLYGLAIGALSGLLFGIILANADGKPASQAAKDSFNLASKSFKDKMLLLTDVLMTGTSLQE